MIRLVVRAVIIAIILTLFTAPAYGMVSSTSLIENASKYSGQRVVYQGEAIGDVMKRGSYGWVNLHDGSNAIGVWAPVEMLRDISFTGDYNHKGDIVLVEGVFDQSCKEHGGDIDIHAESLKIIKVGNKSVHPLNSRKLTLAGIFSLLAVALFAINRYLRRHHIATS